MVLEEGFNLLGKSIFFLSPRFGVCIPIHGKFAQSNRLEFLKNVLRVVEDSPIETLWVEDHFRLPSNEIEASEGTTRIDEPLEAWTTLAAFATLTNRVKLGTEVTPMTLRHPGVLAKMVSNVDILSNGRAILGAGAGWNRPEFITQGIPFEEKEARFAKMREAVEIVKLLWTSDEVDYEGIYYHLKGAYLAPKPVSKPHPPIWFGGFSERILSAIAKYGNGWINATNARPEDVKVQVARLRELLKAEGRSSPQVDVAVPFLTMVSKKADVARSRAELYMGRGKFDRTLRFFADTEKYGLVGTPEECISRIKKYLPLGVGHIIFDVRPPSNTLPTLELLCQEVIPRFS